MQESEARLAVVGVKILASKVRLAVVGVKTLASEVRLSGGGGQNSGE